MSTAYPPPPAGDPQNQPPAQPQYSQQQYSQPYPQQQYGAPGYPPPAGRSNTMAIIALVVGILALLLAWIPVVNFFAIVLGIAALILGFLGIKKAAEVGGKGLAIGGIVTGGLALLGSLLMILVFAAILNSANSNLDDLNTDLQELNEQIQEDLENMDTEG